MNKHWKYLSYIFRHKWFVLVAGWKIGAPLWRLIIHDWSKFLPSEWGPYSNWFYSESNTEEEAKMSSDRFDAAWNSHQKRNRHHWQYWVLRQDSGETKLLEIPDGYMREMVADWMGAGRSITGEWEVHEWYKKNRDYIWLEEKTQKKVDELIDYAEFLVTGKAPRG